MNKKQILFVIGVGILGVVIVGVIEALWHDVSIWMGIVVVALAIFLTGIIMCGGIIFTVFLLEIYEDLGEEKKKWPKC